MALPRARSTRLIEQVRRVSRRSAAEAASTEAQAQLHGIIDAAMDLIDDLSARGLIHDSTDLEFLRSRLDERSVGVYVGFDPTADSLHVGHLLGQLGLRRFQMAGHRPFPLAGGATGMIGDPGGKSEERNLLSREELSHNNISGALDSYGKLIKKARYLDEVIFDLRESLYRHPVDVNIWQSLGDAYMRANRLQDALDAYTKAEELLR